MKLKTAWKTHTQRITKISYSFDFLAQSNYRNQKLNEITKLDYDRLKRN
jgi:hypothetical protein